MLETIKSRCMNFKIYFSEQKKREILTSILNNYALDLKNISLLNESFFDSPGNILKKFLIMEQFELSSENSSLDNINFFIETYLNNENPILLSFINFYIQKFYYDLCFKNSAYLNAYVQNYSKILKQINDMEHFHLNERNVLKSILETIQNEAR